MTRVLRRGRSGSRGQSITELALVLPMMLALCVGGIDIARVYQAWVTLQSATRNASEYAATNSKTATDAANEAMRVVCLETAGTTGYVAGSSSVACSAPSVTIDAFTLDYTVAGVSSAGPLATVRVTTSMDFHTILPYPFITDDGAWTLSATETYTVAQPQ
jgi:Flp pilus assembly protein TadG